MINGKITREQDTRGTYSKIEKYVISQITRVQHVNKKTLWEFIVISPMFYRLRFSLLYSSLLSRRSSHYNLEYMNQFENIGEILRNTDDQRSF